MLWLLGMVMYEMLTGLPPWYTPDRKKLFHRICCAELHFPAYVSFPAECLIRGLLNRNPAKRLGLNAGTLEVGAPADLVLFDPDVPFIMDRFKLRSKSKNTPFDEAKLQGKVLGTWVGGKRVFDA